jgi:hypothetical protein
LSAWRASCIITASTHDTETIKLFAIVCAVCLISWLVVAVVAVVVPSVDIRTTESTIALFTSEPPVFSLKMFCMISISVVLPLAIFCAKWAKDFDTIPY